MPKQNNGISRRRFLSSTLSAAIVIPLAGIESKLSIALPLLQPRYRKCRHSNTDKPIISIAPINSENRKYVAYAIFLAKDNIPVELKEQSRLPLSATMKHRHLFKIRNIALCKHQIVASYAPRNSTTNQPAVIKHPRTVYECMIRAINMGDLTSTDGTHNKIIVLAFGKTIDLVLDTTDYHTQQFLLRHCCASKFPVLSKPDNGSIPVRKIA